MYLLISSFIFELNMELRSKFLSQINDRFYDTLLYGLLECLLHIGKAEIELFIIAWDAVEPIEMEEDFEEQAVEFIDSLFFDHAMPPAYSLVEDAHSSQQIVWFFLIIVRTT